VRALRFGLLLLLIHELQARNWWLEEAGDGARVVVETGVTCEILPGNKLSIPVGMPIRSAKEIKQGGETFYSGYPAIAPNSLCRVSLASTVVWHKGEAENLLLAILDHALVRKGATFEDLVTVENYLINNDGRWQTQAGRDQISGKLQFRWLQLLSRAVGLQGFKEDQPLVEWLNG